MAAAICWSFVCQAVCCHLLLRVGQGFSFIVIPDCSVSVQLFFLSPPTPVLVRTISFSGTRLRLVRKHLFLLLCFFVYPSFHSVSELRKLPNGVSRQDSLATAVFCPISLMDFWPQAALKGEKRRGVQGAPARQLKAQDLSKLSVLLAVFSLLVALKAPRPGFMMDV